MTERDVQRPRRPFLSRNTIGLLAFLAVGGYFLWTEHRAHIDALIPYLPFLLLLACPLMHLFMHHGHGSHGGHDHDAGPQSGQARPEPPNSPDGDRK